MEEDVVGIGIEGTLAPQSGRDTLEVTGHYDRWRQDLALAVDLGIKQVRYPISWHRVEQDGKRDWSYLDQILDYAVGELELKILADTLHHNLPGWFKDGFLDQDIVSAYPDFVQEFAERYQGQIYAYVPFNEPTATLDFCGRRGWWPPYQVQSLPCVNMLRNASLATAEAIRRILKVDPSSKILHVDTCEHHAALDEASRERAFFLNEWRFVFDELLLGRVDEKHSLFTFLTEQGFGENTLASLRQKPVPIHVRGLNYYKLNEEQLLDGATFQAPSHNPKGFCSVALDYWHRLRLPLRMTETNIQGFVTDRISWLKYMRGEYEKLRESLPKGTARGFDWYPLFDCKGWFVLLKDGEWPWDPQGIYYCDDDGTRKGSELSEWYAHLVAGGLAADLPAYEFHAALKEHLCGFLPLMPWEWQSPASPAPSPSERHK